MATSGNSKQQNLLRYADERVANKSIFKRISHSSALHSFRSAANSPGSAASKGLKVVGSLTRKALGLIPIPVVGGVLDSVQSAIEGKIRAHHHHKGAQSADLATRVKFSLKELSIEEMDRYRWKLQDAMKELHAAQEKYNIAVRQSAVEGKLCDELYKVALALAQAKRRYKILYDHCSQLIIILQETQKWCNLQKDALQIAYRDFSKDQFLPSLKEDEELIKLNQMSSVADRHHKCGDYCYIHVPNGRPDEWAATKNILAAIAREVTEPFELDGFVSLDGSDYKVG